MSRNLVCKIKKFKLVSFLIVFLLTSGCDGKTPDKTAEETLPLEIDLSPYTMLPPSSYGRVLLIGDSRTVDTFIATVHEISNLDVNGVTVYAMDGGGYDYLVETIDRYGVDNFDTLITWLGANDAGEFDPYISYYEELVNKGKRLVVCNVGPTDDSHLLPECIPDYTNEKMLQYNESLEMWAEEHDIKVIDMYTFVSGNLDIESVDGVHYEPKPTIIVWNRIMDDLQE